MQERVQARQKVREKSKVGERYRAMAEAYSAKVQAREQSLAEAGFTDTQLQMAHIMARHDQAHTGKIVIKPSDREWEEDRMGRLLTYLDPYYTDAALPDWSVFIHDIHSTSGTHRHQGGLGLFVLEGKGATVMDGVRYDWEKGDLVLLPIKPGGIEHQHLNFSSEGSSKWMAFCYVPAFHAVATEMTHVKDATEWKEQYGSSETAAMRT